MYTSGRRITRGCGFPNNRQNFESAIMQFKLLFPGRHTIITVLDNPIFDAPEVAELIAPRLALIRRAGREYAKTDGLDSALIAEIISPMIPEEVYEDICSRGK